MTDPTLTAHGKSTVHPPTLAWTTLTEAHALAMADLRQNRDSSDTDAAPSRPDATTRREDYYKNFRTALVLSWALSNGLLVAVLSSDRVAPFVIGTYMRFLMYAVAVFALVRLLGAVWFKSRWVVRQY